MNRIHQDFHFKIFATALGAQALPDAHDIYLDAVSSGTDPLRYLVMNGYCAEEALYQRAADAAGLVFAPDIPAPFSPEIPLHTEDLGLDCRIRGTLYGRQVNFFAPSLGQLVALARQIDKHPEIVDTLCVIPPRALRTAQMHFNTIPLFELTRQRLARKWPFASAHLELTRLRRAGFVALLAGLVLFCVGAVVNAIPIGITLMLIFLFLPAWLRLMAVAVRRNGKDDALRDLIDADLPHYAVLIPLRDEAHMVPQLARNMRALDYPRERLDVIFVVEARSFETVAAVERELDTPYFSLFTVPDAPPFTKPKALNYALPLTRAEIAVVFDAEDRPAPDQLRRVAAKLAAEPELDCVQCELVVENADRNWLTALFAAEYGGLFGVMLPALARWNGPVPLGGTSNHFRLSALREVGGWDSFNVTEDADLGVRLSRLRYRVGVLASPTYETMPDHPKAWLAQRTRWLKGWMQTFLVHNRHPLTLFRDLGWRNFLIFEVLVGGMILSAPLHVMFLFAFIAQFAFGDGMPLIALDVTQGVHYLVLFVGYASAAALSLAGLSHVRRMDLLACQILLPLYWGLISIAAVRAGYELVTRPYFWAKTRHFVSTMPAEDKNRRRKLFASKARGSRA